MFNNSDRATAETIALLISAITAVLGNTVCQRGQYGKHCNLTCPLNCAPFPPSNLQPCDRDNGKCSVGCLSGWHGDLCEQVCNMNCLNKTCNRQTGHCTLDCNGTNMGDFCNVTQALTSVVGNNTEESSSLAAILVPVILIAAIGVSILVIAFFRKRRQMKGYQVTEGDFNEMEALLNPGVMSEGRNKVDSKKNMQQEGNTTSGVISEALLDKVMADTVRDFVETDTYRKVKETLEKHGHVTMSGAAGGGKTAIALMLGKWYQEGGYELVLVDDVSKLYVDYYVFQEANKCFIFLDIMRPIERERDVLNLRRVLQQLKKRNQESETKLVVIFTANTYNEKDEISQLGEEGAYFFSGPSFLDFNKLSCPYTPEEKKQIFTKLCQSFCTNLNVEYICGFQQFNFGFPQICTLFVGFQTFQNYGEEFFQKPFHYLKEAIETILQSANDQSGALILMFLCGGSLNLHQVELPSDNEALETLFITMKDVIRITTRTAVAMAVRQFRGSFFTRGDITGFAHPTIYDACACALYKDHRAFVLKHCSIKFLCDHVYTQEARHTANGTMLYVQEAYIVELRNRLAKLNEGHPNYNVLKTLIDK